MGRIADALKKAENERKAHMDVGYAGAATGTALLDPPEQKQFEEQPGEFPADSEARQDGPETGELMPPSSATLSESLVTWHNPSTLVAEQYRSLRTRLLTMNPKNEHRIYAISSAIPREGKSITSLNTAICLAEIQHLNILVVDADLRRGSLSRLLDQPVEPGLADILRGEARPEDAIQSTPLPNLFFLPAGRRKGSGAAEILSSEFANSYFRAFHAQYNYTIIDTPPATFTDVGVIGQLCHSVLLVVRMGMTPEPAVRRAVRMLQVNNVPIAGCIPVGQCRNTGGMGDYGRSASQYYYYYDRE